MGLLDKLASRITLFAFRAILKELRSLRRTLEIGIDLYATTHQQLEPFGTTLVEAVSDLKESLAPGRAIRPGDYQTIWLIEELCREHRIPVTVDTDLEAIAIDRGWLSPEGRLLVLPQAAAGMEMEQGL